MNASLLSWTGFEWREAPGVSATGLRSLRAGGNVEQVWNHPQWQQHPKEVHPRLYYTDICFWPLTPCIVGLEVWEPVSGCSSECEERQAKRRDGLSVFCNCKPRHWSFILKLLGTKRESSGSLREGLIACMCTCMCMYLCTCTCTCFAWTQ